MKNPLVRIVFILGLLGAPAFAQVYDGIALQKMPGNWVQAIPFAQVTVCTSSGTGNPCTPTATIYTDRTLATSTSNPLTADSYGNYTIYAPAGVYFVCVSGVSSACNYIAVASTSAGLADPGANGVLKRTSLNTTAIATATDLIGLWTGSCDSTHALFGDGTCQAISSAFSAITSGTNTSAAMHVGTGASLDTTGSGTIAATSVPWSGVQAGTNTNALVEGSAGSVKPVNLGQIAGNQAWLQPGLSIPAMTAANSGGSIGSGHSVQWQYTFNTASGQTTPSVLLTGNPPAPCASGSCTVTMTAPTIPSGYSGYTAYFCDPSGGGGCTAPVEVLACVNISTGCTVTNAALNSGVALPTTNTSIITPPNVQATNGPAGFVPQWFFPKTDGNYYPWLGVEWNSCDASGGPPLPCGTPMFTHRTWFSDQQTATVGGKNAFVLIDHNAGVGTVTTNQDRALWVNLSTPTSDSATRYALEAIQSELDFSCNGCSINGSPDGEITDISSQLQDSSAANYTSPSFGTNALRATLSKTGAGSGHVYSVYRGQFNSTQNTYAGGDEATFFNAISTFGGVATNLQVNGFKYKVAPDSQKPSFQVGAYFPSTSFTPSAPGSGDYLIRNEIHNWYSSLNGPVGFTEIDYTDGANGTTLPINASATLAGGLAVSQIANSWTPGYSAACSGGASTYTYQLVAVDGNGGTTGSTTFNSATCTNPLTSGNPATLNPGAGVRTSAVFRQAKSIDVYRVGGPMGTGKIGTLVCNNNVPLNSCAAFSDTGLTATGTVPSTNTTGEVAAAGYMAAQMNTVRVGPSGFTTAANTNLQTITGLSWNLDGSAKNYSFHCALAYSQATANAAVAFGIQAATVAPTNIFAKGNAQITVGPPATYVAGVLATLNTTTATAIVSGTPGATATNYIADLDGSIEEPANNQGQVINIMVSTATSGDAVSVLRGSYCYLY